MKTKAIVLFLGFILLLGTGCRKKKIEKNLDGSWTLTELVIDGSNEVTANTSIRLEFSSIKKGEGNVSLVSTDAQGSYYSSGTVSIDKKYESMTMTFVEPGWTFVLDGEFEVTESKFELNGTYSNSSGDNLPLIVKGFQ